jgi:crossover junction endodeoxyribonuclease RuvC
MVIIGVDPGTAITGYGVIEFTDSRFKLVDSGCIMTQAGKPLAERLSIIHRQLTEILKEYRPTEFAVEELFFNTNTRSALAVGHARGVVLLAAADVSLSVHEYTPLQVKLAVTGFGRAEKGQVQYMVKKILALPALPHPDDMSDALAVAICHAHCRGRTGVMW